jgi:undecaprenyl pyrophosphate synthase
VFDAISPDWGKYGGLIGLVCGSLLMLLAILVTRVMPGMRQREAAQDDKWFAQMIETFTEQARLEREQCDKHHTANLKLYQLSLEAAAIRHSENMAAHRDTERTIRELAYAISSGKRPINGGIVQ